MLGSFGSSSAVGSSTHGLVTGNLLNASIPTTSGLTDWLNTGIPNQTIKPKAYINWILFDEQFKPVRSGCGADPINDNPNLLLQHSRSVNIGKSGYLYVFCSNESNADVFFDNLQLIHTRGPLLEETHYYPFGLTMAGISSKAAGKLENKYKFLDREKQSNDFSDGSGLEEYDLGARFYDPQIGKFHSVDPLADYMRRWSPYVYSYNNPIRFADASGRAPSDTVVLPEVTVTGHKKQSTLSSIGNFLWGAVDYIPFAGSIKQIGTGIYNGDWKQISMGVVFLAVDAVTAGEGGELLHAGEAVVEDVLKVGVEDEVKEVAEKTIAETVGEEAVHGNSTKSAKPTEKYTLVDQNGKEYHGVGKPGVRAEQSAKRLTKENPGKAFRVKDRQTFPNRTGALKAEAKGLEFKTLRHDVYNKINSPGAKL